MRDGRSSSHSEVMVENAKFVFRGSLAPMSKADALKTLDERLEGHPPRCARCGGAVSIVEVLLMPTTSLWQRTPKWEVMNVIPREAQAMNTREGLTFFVHDSCLGQALPHLPKC